MTGKELIIALMSLDSADLDKEIKIYSLVDMENIDTNLSQFEFIGDNLEVGDSADGDFVFIEGYY